MTRLMMFFFLGLFLSLFLLSSSKESIATDATGDAKTTCLARSGFYWDSANNSCQRTEDLSSLRVCKDKASDEEKQSCIHDAILNLETMKENDINDKAIIDGGKIENFSQWPLSIIHGTFFLINAGIWKFGGSTCMSVKVLTLASLVSLGTDVGTWLYLKYKLDDLKKEFDKLPTNNLGDTVTSYTEFQKQTFTLLSKAYEERSKIEKIRTIAYGATTALYAVAAIATAYEMSNHSTCMGNPSEGAKEPQKGTDELTKQVSDKMSSLGKASTPLVQKIYMGPVRLGLSVGMGILSGYLAAQTWKAHKTSEERKKIIDQMSTNLTSTTFEGICDGSARTDSSKPQCYCFNEKGERNLAERSGSDICKNYWNSLDYPTKTKEGAAYNKATGSDTVRSGCVSVDRQFDPLCQCKKLVNAKGDNACLKASSTINQAAPSGAGWSAELSKTVNQLLSGQNNGFSANTAGSMARLAGKLNQINEREAAKLNANRIKKGEAEIKMGMENANNLLTQGKKLLENEDVKKNLGDLSGSTTTLLDNTIPSEQIKKDQDWNKDESLKYSKNNQGKDSSKKKDGKNSFNLDSYYLEESAQDKRISQMKASDSSNENNKSGFQMEGGIEKNDSSNIWDIISNAYKGKGLEKLFK